MSILIIGTLICSMGGLLMIPKSMAILGMSQNPGEWGVSLGDNLIYYTQINLSGSIQTGYIGYQVANNYTGSAQIGMMGSDQFYDAMDLTQLEWNGTSNEAEPIGQIFTEIWNGSITQGFYNIANNGFPPLAPLIIPLNSTGGLNLTYWGTAITNLANPNAIFPNSLGLYQYNVIGNQLQIYNSTSGYYINGTYFSNGTLASSRVQCMVPNGGSGMVLLQENYTSGGSMSMLNPLTSTSFTTPPYNALIFNQTSVQNSVYNSNIESYNITYDGPAMIDGGSGLQSVVEVNATSYSWDNYNLTWYQDNNMINQTIGAADNNQNYVLQNGFNFIYKIGTTGANLQSLLGDWQYQWNGSDINTITANSFLTKNTTTGYYFYVQVNSQGIPTNTSYNFYNGGQYVSGSMIYETFNQTGLGNLTTNMAWPVNVGGELVYNFTGDYNGLGLTQMYCRYLITSFTYAPFNGMGGEVGGLFVNATFANWTISSVSWQQMNDPFGNSMTTIGAQNQLQVFMNWNPGSINSLVFTAGTTPQMINDTFGPGYAAMGPANGFNQFTVGSNYWMASNGSNPEQFLKITVLPNGEVSEFWLNNTDSYQQFELMNASDLPNNSMPICNFTSSSNNGTASFSGSWTSSHSPVSYEWNFGDPSSGSSNFNTTSLNPTHVYTSNGTYTVTLTVTDNIDNQAVYTSNITIVIILPTTPTNSTTTTTTTTNSTTTSSSTKGLLPTIAGYSIIALFVSISCTIVVISRMTRKKWL